ncbi:MAG: hypothetical protein WB557_05945, partial [Solirubrobacteraceae bacterium]
HRLTDAAGFVPAVLGLVRVAPYLSSATRSCSPGLTLGARTALYVIGQMLERLLKDTPDDR